LLTIAVKGATMETFAKARSSDQLRKRREQIALTLRHLEKEHAEVERNTDWLDQRAYESRVRLLDRLTDWYLTEINQIDAALRRAEKDDYGFCIACHRAIESARLEAVPETELCAACQKMREALEIA
jgi:DnaK suppressor protein